MLDRKPITFAIDNVFPSDALRIVNDTLGNPCAQEMIGEVKFNDVLHGDRGRNLLREIRREYPWLGIFADLKLPDVAPTNVNILNRYDDCGITRVTVTHVVSAHSMLAIQAINPKTSITLYCVPTDMSEDEAVRRFGKTPFEIIRGALDGFEREFCEILGVPNPISDCVCSGCELVALREVFGDRYGFVVPGIRSEWMGTDHQKRTMSPFDALMFGAKRLVMGSQLRGTKDISMQDAQQRTRDEIQRAYTQIVC